MNLTAKNQAGVLTRPGPARRICVVVAVVYVAFILIVVVVMVVVVLVIGSVCCVCGHFGSFPPSIFLASRFPPRRLEPSKGHARRF